MLLALIASVVLAVPFGPAAATGSPGPSGIVVEVELAMQALPAPTTVLAHVVSGSRPQETHALALSADGVFRTTFAAPAEDADVVFEALWPDGTTAASESVRFSELGVDTALLTPPPSLIDRQTSVGPDGGSRWGWLALGAGALAAAAGLAWWALRPRPD